MVYQCAKKGKCYGCILANRSLYCARITMRATMDHAEPNPTKTTAELYTLVCQEFRTLFRALKEAPSSDLPPFIKVDKNEVRFLYEGGMAHQLLGHDDLSRHLANHLELVYFASELFNHQLRAHLKAPPLIERRREITRRAPNPLPAAKLIVTACASDPDAVRIEFHPG